MGNLRRSFERFCYRNRNKGIPNLMLYIVIGSAIVYLLSLINGGSVLYEWLRFDKTAILKGQVWRLFTYIFTYSPGLGPILVLVGLYFFYNISRHVEGSMGTLKFNIYYFSGMLMMDVFALIFCPTAPVVIGEYLYDPVAFTEFYSDMALYLHMSIILMFSALNPNAQFLVFFIIPVKAWFIALLDLVLLLIPVINMTMEHLFPHSLFPLVGILNFLLFAGKDVINLFPFLQGIKRKKPTVKQSGGSIPSLQKSSESQPKKAGYTHRCSICGRTDVSHPNMEFRYCSRCKGYFCYCQDHINAHSHIEE